MNICGCVFAVNFTHTGDIANNNTPLPHHHHHQHHCKNQTVSHFGVSDTLSKQSYPVVLFFYEDGLDISSIIIKKCGYKQHHVQKTLLLSLYVLRGEEKSKKKRKMSSEKCYTRYFYEDILLQHNGCRNDILSAEQSLVQ